MIENKELSTRLADVEIAAHIGSRPLMMMSGQGPDNCDPGTSIRKSFYKALHCIKREHVWKNFFQNKFATCVSVHFKIMLC